MDGVLLSNSTRRTKRLDKPIDSNDPIIRRGHKARGTILLTAWPQHAPPHGGPLPSRRASAARYRAAALLSSHGVETHRSPPQPHRPDLGGAGTVGTNLPTPLLSVTVVSCARLNSAMAARRLCGVDLTHLRALAGVWELATTIATKHHTTGILVASIDLEARFK